MQGAASGAITGAITSPFCFVAGTLVLTAEGLVPIEAVSAGDIVWAEDPESGEQSLSSVVQTFENETEALVHVTVEGDTITSTPHHPFYSPVKGWTDALDLRAGDILVRSNGEYVIVEQVQHEILENPVKVYNFEVQDYHTYYVGCREVLVHNMCGGVHGNSKLSMKPQHGYQIYNKATNDVVKTGISGQKLNLDGSSPRATAQVNRFNRAEGAGTYVAKVVITGISGRAEALVWERQNAKRLLELGNSMSKHVKPR